MSYLGDKKGIVWAMPSSKNRISKHISNLFDMVLFNFSLQCPDIHFKTF